MRAGWNGSYILHCVLCKEWVSKASKLLILTVVVAVFAFAFPMPPASVFSEQIGLQPVYQEVAFQGPAVPVVDPAVRSIEAFLKRYAVEEAHRGRITESIVSSARKYDLEPKLIASIMILESRANPFAISSSDSIGIMQIHLPTWGPTADREGINLFRIEDNIDFGSRILKDYIRQFGLWEGVKRYKGWIADDPVSQQAVQDYVAKVQRISSLQQPAVSSADLLQ
jgi:hypothetical protein